MYILSIILSLIKFSTILSTKPHYKQYPTHWYFKIKSIFIRPQKLFQFTVIVSIYTASAGLCFYKLQIKINNCLQEVGGGGGEAWIGP